MALSRAMRLTYGSYVAGYGQDRRHVEGFVRVGPAGPDVVEVAFTIALTCAAPGASNDLEDEVTAFRAAFDVPNQTLLVEMVDTSAGTNLANLVEIDPSASDRNATRVFPHYETDPRGCSQASHVFNVTVRAGRIASYDANHVRATDPVRFEVTAPDNRIRVLRIMGTATATAGAGARLTAIAAVAALRTSLASTLGGTWPTTARNDSYRPDPEDHECAFVAEFKERVVNEAVGTLDHASIGDQQLLVSVSEVGADLGSRQDRPMLGVTASGRYAIDADVTTDLAATWEDVVLPWIEQNMSELAGGGQLYVLEAQPRYDVENNTIMPHVVGVVPGSGRQLFRRIRVVDRITFGWTFRHPFPTAGDPEDHRPDPAYAYRLAKSIVRTVEVVSRVIGQDMPPDLGALLFRPPAEIKRLKRQARGSGDGGKFLLAEEASYSPRVLGLPGDNQTDTTDRTDSMTFTVVAAPPRSVGGARGDSGAAKRVVTGGA